MIFFGFERLLDDICPNWMHPDPGFEIWSDFEAAGGPKVGPRFPKIGFIVGRGRKNCRFDGSGRNGILGDLRSPDW